MQSVVPQAELHTPYGMTEALPVTDVSLPELEAVGPGEGICVGRPLPSVVVGVSAFDETGGVEAEPTTDASVSGEVLVRAAHVKDRYDQLWATERESSRTAGWHRTGDVGHLDDDGRLWVEGRLVHVVHTASGPVTPVGPEQRIEGLEGVSMAAVVGVGPVGTQQVVAVVVPTAGARPGLAAPDLASAVRSTARVTVAAVLVARGLPVDIRHASKIDRARVARWAARVLEGGRVGHP